MKLLFDSFWRAVAYLFLPRVLLLSVLPLLVAVALALALGYFFWAPAVDYMRVTLDGWWASSSVLGWIEATFGTGVRHVLPGLTVLALSAPAVVIVSLLLVAALMTPALVKLVGERRFPLLERRHGAGWIAVAARSLGLTLVAVVVLILSIPLWLIPPLVLILPPLIWGWLTTQVMGHEVLSEHASKGERQTLLAEHRWPLLVIGIVTGYLGAAPTLVWAFGVLSLVFAPFFVIVSVWLYTMVFAFSGLWFAHYALAALDAMRQAEVAAAKASAPAPPPAAATSPSGRFEPPPVAPPPMTPPPKL